MPVALKPIPGAESSFEVSRFIDACKVLDIYVRDRLVAKLTKAQGVYEMTYLPGVPQSDFVSLIMPVRDKPYRHMEMLPYFDMNLPEGAMLETLYRKYGGDFALNKMAQLGLVGTNMIGVVKAVPEGFALDWRLPPNIDNEQLMKRPDATSYFAELMDTCVGGISGVVPKVMHDTGRFTIKGAGWIYKHDHNHNSDMYNMEGVSMNEYLSLLAAKRAGLPVTDMEISEDGHTIALKRFDNGLRFEDFCSLSGVSGEHKYKGSMERLSWITGKLSCRPSLDKAQLVRSHILNMIVGNGDAHLKNFGVLYHDRSDVALSPTFDVVTVRAFDVYYGDKPALSLGGEREWSLSDDFMQWAAHDCGVPPNRVAEMLGDVIDAVQGTMADIAAMGDKHAWFREQAKKMILVWEEGVSAALNQPMIDDSIVLARHKMSGIKMEQIAPSVFDQLNF